MAVRIAFTLEIGASITALVTVPSTLARRLVRRAFFF
jgi:hypothetical protein